MAARFWVGGTGTWDTTSTANWSATSGGAAGASAPTTADTVTFDANSGTGTCTTAANATCSTLTFNSATVGLTLGANLTITGALTFTQGAFTLNSYTLSCLYFSSSNSNTRSIAFGTGNITVTNGNTGIAVWNMSTATGFSYTGTPTVKLSYTASSSGTRTIAHAAASGGTEANAVSFYVINGTDTVAATTYIKTLDFSGFSGTFANGTGARRIYGDLTFSSGMTVTGGSGTFIFDSSSGTQTVTSNGITVDAPFQIGSTNSTTVAFQDALTQGSTRAFTLTKGTVQLKNGVTSTVGALATSGTVSKVLQSTSAGSQATLSQASGSFNAQYLTVKDIAATGGAKFNALNNCVTQGNNSGWYFAPQLGRPLPSFAF